MKTLADFWVPPWLKPSATVLHGGVPRVVETVEVMPSRDKYWADKGEAELHTAFEDGNHAWGLTTLADPNAKPKRTSRK